MAACHKKRTLHSLAVIIAVLPHLLLADLPAGLTMAPTTMTVLLAGCLALDQREDVDTTLAEREGVVSADLLALVHGLLDTPEKQQSSFQ
jgi:hypothetical protein